MDPEKNMHPLDHLILTTSRPALAEAFRRQLQLRHQDGLFPSGTQTHVVVDPEGRAVGSGGSTLGVWKHLLWTLPRKGSIAETLAGLKILVIHAGGTQPPLPACAALGNLFLPLPCPSDGRTGFPAHPGGLGSPSYQETPVCLFDLLWRNLSRTPTPPGGHVLVASGDVLLTFEPAEFDGFFPGVVGVAYPDLPERACQHGVYVLRDQGRVVDFLQKPDPTMLQGRKALDVSGRALIDTGLLSFDPDAVAAICQAAGLDMVQGQLQQQPGLLTDLEEGRVGKLDLYEEVVQALGEQIDLAAYQARVLRQEPHPDPQSRQHLADFFQKLRPLGFHARVLSFCDFFHVHSNQELLTRLLGKSRTSLTYGFQNGAHAVTPANWPRSQAFVFNSIVSSNAVSCGPGVLLESVNATCPLELAGLNLVTGLPAEVSRPVRLPEGVGLTMLPVGEKDWAAVLFGIDDEEAGLPLEPTNLFLNRPLEEFLHRFQALYDTLWKSREQGAGSQGSELKGEEKALGSGVFPSSLLTPHSSLAEAQLWCRGTADEVVSLAEAMLAAQPAEEAVQAWKRGPRWSLNDLVALVNLDRVAAHRSQLRREWFLHRPFQRLKGDPDFPAAQLVEKIHQLGEAVLVLKDLAAGLQEHPDPGLRARVLTLAEMLWHHAEQLPPDPASWEALERAFLSLNLGGTLPEALNGAAMAAVVEMVAKQAPVQAGLLKAAISHDQVIWATAPARLDFAGGWSDTPPICMDRGGLVVNAAIRLNGQYPIQAIIKLRHEPVIGLNSIDLGQRVVLDRVEQLLEYRDPGHWSSLPRACLCLAGLSGGRQEGELRPILEQLGGGLDLTLFSALPKGSGLGTSSILGATILGCLARLTGQPLNQNQIIARTSLLEQLMTTGGGWQDQVGGILPGIKTIRTHPGSEQNPDIFWLPVHSNLFAPRVLLYFTGWQRLAKNILQQVVQRYLQRDPRVVHTVARLKEGVLEVQHALQTRDYEGFARGVGRYWELKKQIDPQSTNPRIEQLLQRVQPDCLGYTLLGAGGGGFLLLAARDELAASRIRVDLDRKPCAAGARFFDFEIDDKGLHVTVL